jgi:hypothetical protein
MVWNDTRLRRCWNPEQGISPRVGQKRDQRSPPNERSIAARWELDTRQLRVQYCTSSGGTRV